MPTKGNNSRKDDNASSSPLMRNFFNFCSSRAQMPVEEGGTEAAAR